MNEVKGRFPELKIKCFNSFSANEFLFQCYETKFFEQSALPNIHHEDKYKCCKKVTCFYGDFYQNYFCMQSRLAVFELATIKNHAIQQILHFRVLVVFFSLGILLIKLKKFLELICAMNYFL